MYTPHCTPPHLLTPSSNIFPIRDTSHLETLAVYSRFVAVCLVTQLRELDLEQIKVGFLYPLHGRRGVFKRQSSSLYQCPVQSLSRNPHPLVTERGGDPVNYRRVPHCEQWFIHPATLHSPQHLHSHTDTSQPFRQILDHKSRYK